MANTYTKLKSGAWGVKVSGETKAGEKVEVVKRDGSHKFETVASVVWSGNGVSLCSIIPSVPLVRGTPTRSAGGGRGGRLQCEDCGDYVTAGTRCWETGLTH